MTDPFFVQPDGVLDKSTLHSEVGSGLSGVPAAHGNDVQRSHGAIASSVGSALHSALAARTDTLDTTSTSASTISDLLEKAAHAYATGDEEGASRLRAAAAVLEGGGAPTGPDVGGGAGAQAAGGAAGSPGADAIGPLGQILGSVGQQIGQLTQLITAPLQGLAQGLQQVPQQIMQGTQAARSTGVDDVDLTATETTAEEREADDAAPRREQAEPVPADDAQADKEIPPGRAPMEAAESVPPAPTRPQVD